MQAKKMSRCRIAAVLWQKMIFYASKEIYFQEFNLKPVYIINLGYPNSLLKRKPTSNQKQLKEVERAYLK